MTSSKGYSPLSFPLPPEFMASNPADVEAMMRDRLANLSLRYFIAESFPTLEMNPRERFADSFYVGVMAEHLEAIFTGQLRRLVLTAPAGSYKSRAASVAMIGYDWQRNPWRKYLVGTNSQDLGIELSDLTRRLLRSDWFRRVACPPWAIRDDTDAKTLFANTAGGQRQVTSTGATVAGKKAHILIADDLHDSDTVHSKAVRDSDKAWFRNTFWDRQVNFAESAILVVGFRTHIDDMQSELINEGWPELRLPERMDERNRKTFPLGGTDPRKEGEYLRPGRFGPKEERAARTNSEAGWHAKNQQVPKSAEGTMFPREKARTIPAIPAGTTFVRYWDTAATTKVTSSNTSGALVGRTPTGRTVIADLVRGKMGPSDRNEKMISTAREDRWRTGVGEFTIWIENPGGSGGVEAAQIMVKDLGGFTVFIDPVSKKGNKVHRAGPLSSQWMAGNVDIVEGDWNKGFLERMELFDGQGDCDDTDAAAAGYNKLAAGNTGGAVPETGGRPEVDRMQEGTFRDERDESRGEDGYPEPEKW